MCDCNNCSLCDERYDEDDERDDYDEEEWMREQERMAECHCGAFVYSKKLGEYIHVADCVC